MKRKTRLWVIIIAILLASASLDAASGGIGRRFMQETGLSLLKVIGSAFRITSPPPLYKEYPMATKIKLPVPDYKGLSLEEAIKKRRSVRNYTKASMTKAQLSQLLYAAQGVTGESQGRLLRSSPSAGALYPIEVYAVVNNVSGVKRGIYHYGVRKHDLAQVKLGDYRSKLIRACLDQEMAGDAQVSFILSSIYGRVCAKYGERGYRYALIEAGHIGQNIYLQAVSLGLGAVAVGAFYDDKLNSLLALDGETEAAIYVLSVGGK